MKLFFAGIITLVIMFIAAILSVIIGKPRKNKNQ